MPPSPPSCRQSPARLGQRSTSATTDLTTPSYRFPATELSCCSRPSNGRMSAPSKADTTGVAPNARRLRSATAPGLIAIVAPWKSLGANRSRVIPAGLRNGPGRIPMPVRPSLSTPGEHLVNNRRPATRSSCNSIGVDGHRGNQRVETGDAGVMPGPRRHDGEVGGAGANCLDRFGFPGHGVVVPFGLQCDGHRPARQFVHLIDERLDLLAEPRALMTFNTTGPAAGRHRPCPPVLRTRQEQPPRRPPRQARGSRLF